MINWFDTCFLYYGVDWLLFVLIVLHLWLLGNQIRFAFIVGFVGTICGLILGFLIGSLATILMNIVFALMHLRAYYLWKNIDIHVADLIPLVDEIKSE